MRLASSHTVLLLQMCVSVSKEKKKEIRARALMNYEEKLCSESRSKAEKKRTERKYALESMMKVCDLTAKF